jgi:hypothetical protein
MLPLALIAFGCLAFSLHARRTRLDERDTAAGRKRRWWRLPGDLKPALAIVALLEVGLATCSLLMGVTPGPQSYFRNSANIFRFAQAWWTDAPHSAGGLENIAVSPAGVVWATTPGRHEIVRWDGSRWVPSRKEALGRCCR